ERLGIPTETARTRVKRGIAALRGRLDREYDGDSTRWGFALAGWIPRTSSIPPAVGSGTRGARVAAAAIVIAAGTAWWWLANSQTTASSETPVELLASASPTSPSAGPANANSEARESSSATAARDELRLRVVGDDDRAP